MSLAVLTFALVSAPGALSPALQAAVQANAEGAYEQAARDYRACLHTALRAKPELTNSGDLAERAIDACTGAEKRVEAADDRMASYGIYEFTGVHVVRGDIYGAARKLIQCRQASTRKASQC